MDMSSSSGLLQEGDDVENGGAGKEEPDEFDDEKGRSDTDSDEDSEEDYWNDERESEDVKKRRDEIEKLWSSLKTKLAAEVKEDELSRMKELSKHYLHGGDLNRIDTTIDLLQELEICHAVRSTDTSKLLELLEDIGRTDLAFEVLQYGEKRDELRRELRLLRRRRRRLLELEPRLDFYRRLQELSQRKSTHKKIYRGRVMLVGAYGAGKTSTKRSLFDEPYEERHLSTDGADIYNIDITEWIIKEFTTKYQGQSKKSIEETQKMLGDVLILEMNKSGKYPKASKTDPAKVVEVIEAVKLKGEKMEDTQRRLTERLEEAGDVDKPDIYFSLWDFAGQSVYYITHQVFLGNRVIFVLVTDLTKSLEDIMSTVVEDEWTVKEFLCFWMNSIHTHALPGSDISLKLKDGRVHKTPGPPVIILGTKKDLLKKSNIPLDAEDVEVEKEAKRRLQEISEYLRRNATKAVNAHIVGMIAIDNKSRLEDGTAPDLDVEKLREKLQEYAMEYFFLGKVPVKWIRLELSMRQLRKEKICLEEAKELGKKLDMTEDEINHALEFYHSVGEILHLQSIPELKDTVILDVVWLVNLFKILITQSLTYKEQVEDVPPKVCSLIEELHLEGRLHEELLDYLLERHDRHQDKDILLAVAEMYDILFMMPDTESDTPVYYLPSLLQKDAAGKNGVVCPADSKSCNPIYFHFQGNFLPEGLFYRLVVRCMKRWPNEEMALRKHRARIFIENDNVHFTLCKKGSDIELKALIMPEFQDTIEFQPELLSNIRSVVEHEINILINTYTPNITYKVCIKCQCPNHHSGKLLQGSEDMDDRCVSVKEVKGKVKVICKKGVKQLLYPDLKLWYDTGTEKPMKDIKDSDNAPAKLGSAEVETRGTSDGCVLTIGHEWGTQKCGVANLHQLTSSLVAETGRKVHATVLEANNEEQQDAASRGVQLMLPVPVDGGDPEVNPIPTWLTTYHTIHYPSLMKIPDVEVVIGHLLTTSKVALNAQNKYYKGKKVILFNHVLPQDTEVKIDELTPTRLDQKEADIFSDVSRSHVVFSVGPRVYHHFQNKFSMLTGVKHELFLPMPDEDFFRLGTKKPSTASRCQILTCGKIDHMTHMKGYDTVALGLSEYVNNLKKWKSTLTSPVWRITGIQGERAESACDFIKKHVSSGHLEYKVVPHWSKMQIKYDLQESHLCLIPSDVEPYGMVGLEAIAAGIPILANSNSGLAKFLTKYMDQDKASAVIVDVGVTDRERDRDIDRWAKSVAEVFGDYDYAFKRAQDMKEMLRNCQAIKDTHALFKKKCSV